MALRLFLLTVLALGTLTIWSNRAQAYPQWQFSSGTSRCSQCHYNPAGGGLVTGYARDAVGEELSTWEGDGSFAHGLIDLPKWLALQGDFRYAALVHDTGEAEGGEFAHFPMQADGIARVSLSDAFSVYVSAGLRGRVRTSDEEVGYGAAEPVSSSRFISREHYIQWRPAALGPYVRVGRFFAPYGLRLAEHYTYVRRDTGFNTLEETYNFSFGMVRNEWEIHLTGFAPDQVRDMGGNEYGGAGVLEFRLGDASQIGVQGRAGFNEDRYRFMGGLTGKTYLEDAKTLIQTELNLVHNTFPGDVVRTQSFVGYLGVTFFPFQGFWITPFGERVQTDISVRDTATNAGGLQLNWFPYPHFEIVGLGRYQAPSGEDTAATGMVFLHYYL